MLDPNQNPSSEIIQDPVFFLRHDAGHIEEGTFGTEDAQKSFGKAVANLLDDLYVRGQNSPLLQRALAGYAVLPGLETELNAIKQHPLEPTTDVSKL